MTASDLQTHRSFFSQNRSWLDARIVSYVTCQSYSGDDEGLGRMADLIEADLHFLGANVLSNSGPRRMVAANFGPDPDIVLIFHHDTVWPRDSFPPHIDSANACYGPGIFDMKANIPLMLLVLRRLQETNPELLRHIAFVSSPDEEIIGDVSAGALMKFATACDTALVFEPPGPNGGFKNRRKGVMRMMLAFTGIATHAGNGYFQGKSALAAAARFLLAAEQLTDDKRGFTVNVGLLKGGSAVNTRPGHADMALDVRFFEPGDQQLIQDFLGQYRDPDGVEIRILEQRQMPAMDSHHELWQHLEQVCRRLDQPYELVTAGGGSDGSRLADAGLKVMDGLGTPGGGEHADHEHIDPTKLEGSFLRNLLLLESLTQQR